MAGAAALVEWQFPVENRSTLETIAPALYPNVSELNANDPIENLTRLTNHAKWVASTYEAGRGDGPAPFLLNFSDALPQVIETLIKGGVRVFSFSSSMRDVQWEALEYYQYGIDKEKAGSPIGSKENPFAVEGQPAPGARQYFMAHPKAWNEKLGSTSTACLPASRRSCTKRMAPRNTDVSKKKFFTLDTILVNTGQKPQPKKTWWGGVQPVKNAIKLPAAVASCGRATAH